MAEAEGHPAAAAATSAPTATPAAAATAAATMQLLQSPRLGSGEKDAADSGGWAGGMFDLTRAVGSRWPSTRPDLARRSGRR